MRKVYMALFGGSLLATAPFAFATDLGTGPTVTIAVYGDAPYGATATDDSQTLATPAFVQAINQAGVDAVMHVGDIHSGKQYCTEAYNRQIFTMWSAFEAPLIYTPGDNEWTDCQKKAEGGGAYNATTGQIDYVLDANGNPVDYANGDPIANLALIRSIFFSHVGQSLGRHPIGVTSQATLYDPAHPSDANYVENVMWQAKGVLFVTINLPGGSNNDTDPWYGAPAQPSAQTAEIAERTGADLRWLDAAFARAAEDNFTAVVLQFQADMWDTEKGAAHQTAYEPIVQRIASHALAFGKPVLILNGDSHVYRSDNPLAASDPLNFMHPGYNVPNTHRIVVHGSTTPLEWLRLTIDPRVNAPAGPDAFGPFSWQRVTE